MEKSQPAKRTKARQAAGSMDAIALLKADHRQVEKWFAQFKKTRASSQKEKLAKQICNALKVHTAIEEELFYPAFIEATDDKDMHHEAVVEHAGAKKLIAEIEGLNGDDEYYDAKVVVLSEMIKHHVKEEEQPGGMFAEARKSNLDLENLGTQLKERKMQLEGNGNKSSGRLRGVAKKLFDA